MSAIDQTLSAASSDVKPKKERAPRLPAKFGKFIEFGFYFVQFYNQSIAQANDGRTPLDQDAINLALQVFGSVADQQSFVQGFFDNSKDIKKQIRDSVKKFNKANSPTTRKPRAKKTKDDEPAPSVSSPVAEDKPKAKRGRKPAALVANGNPDIVAEIVAIAQGNPTPTPTPTPAPAKPAKLTAEEKKAAADEKKKAKKDAADAAKLAAADDKKKNKKDTDAKADKKKTAKDAKADKKNPPTVTPSPPVTVQDVNSDDDDDEDPLQVSILSLNGKQYLIDDDKTVYDFQSQEPIGTFNPDSQSINPL
jgi:hypothetical protein